MKKFMRISLAMGLLCMSAVALCQSRNAVASWGESTWDPEGTTGVGFDVRVNDQTPFQPLQTSRSLFRYEGYSYYGEFATNYGFRPQYFVAVTIRPGSVHVLAYGEYWSFNSITGPSRYSGFASLYAHEGGFTLYRTERGGIRLAQMRTGIWTYQSWGNQEYGGTSGGQFKTW